jgi:uridine kinase
MWTFALQDEVSSGSLLTCPISVLYQSDPTYGNATNQCMTLIVKRDVAERGFDIAGVLKLYQRFVKPSYDNYVYPTKKSADVVKKYLLDQQFVCQSTCVS